MDGIVPDYERRKAKVVPVYETLRAVHGELEWEGNDPMDELVSCILSQSISGINRDCGFDALKAAYP